MMNEHITETIAKHLAESPNNRVVITTYTRQTVYQPKHASWFTKPANGEAGVYVKSGKKKVYVFPQYIRFGHMV